jgi:hypothetical protein
MGLDMYLYSIPKIEGLTLEEILLANIHLREHEARNDAVFAKIKDHIKSFRDSELDRTWKSLQTKVAYWRKANQIHNWFVVHVLNGEDECGSYEITKENLQELHNHCVQILSKKAKAPKLLPTKSGFYFGSTDYDDYYYREIKRTKSLLEDILQNINFDTHYLVYNFLW